jgi:hypothetical protein
MSDRKQSVSINGTTSESHVLDCGIPQGSVLGPLFFVSYTLPLADILRHHNISFHLYADDTQIYLAFKPSEPMSEEDARTRLEECIIDIRSWMAQNFLKLNDDKTEFMVLGTREQLKKLRPKPVKIGNSSVEAVTTVRNIGAYFDQTLNLKEHITKTCRAARFHLRNIGKIRQYLNKETTAMLVHAFVTSRLDNLNGLLYGLPACQIDHLQKIQNNAARLVTKSRRQDHITPVLIELHWLPVKFRIDFKILLLTYKALKGEGLGYLKELLQKVPSGAHTLRSHKDRTQLVPPVFRLATYGCRSFSSAAPLLWNACQYWSEKAQILEHLNRD